MREGLALATAVAALLGMQVAISLAPAAVFLATRTALVEVMP